MKYIYKAVKDPVRYVCLPIFQTQISNALDFALFVTRKILNA